MSKQHAESINLHHVLCQSDIDLIVVDEVKRIFRLAFDVDIILITDSGNIRISAKKGFITDGRSGGFLVDLLIPNIGNKYYRRDKNGFITDGRSGGLLVDLLIPNIGNKYYRRAWFVHDVLYAFAANCEKNGEIAPISFELANDLFYRIAVLPKRLGGGGVAAWRMKLAKAGVDSMFGRKAYETMDGNDRKNYGLCNVTWPDK